MDSQISCSELEEGEGPLSQPRNEAAKSGQRSSKLLDVLDAARRPHRLDPSILAGLP